MEGKTVTLSFKTNLKTLEFLNKNALKYGLKRSNLINILLQNAIQNFIKEEEAYNEQLG